jgi:ActR/RegA family two-component response regulator
VIGPVHSLSRALQLADVEILSAAVLDLRLEAGDTLPVAARLAERAIPFLFQTSDPAAALKAVPEALVLSKPVSADALVQALENLV